MSRLLSFMGFMHRDSMPEIMNEMIWYAILGKRKISFDYNGHRRIIEPHVYGMKKGKDQIQVRQVGGQTSDGETLPVWRRMNLEGVTNMKILDETFPGRIEVKGLHSRFDKIYVIVAW